MEERLTQEELVFIEETISFYKTSGVNSLKGGILISILCPLLGHLILGFSLQISALIMLGLILFTIYIWYDIFEGPSSRLKQDLIKGTKIIQTATINKIKSTKEGNIYQMSNGLNLKERDFEDTQTLMENIEKGKELILTYTPCQKLILKVKGKNTPSN